MGEEMGRGGSEQRLVSTSEARDQTGSNGGLETQTVIASDWGESEPWGAAVSAVLVIERCFCCYGTGSYSSTWSANSDCLSWAAVTVSGSETCPCLHLRRRGLLVDHCLGTSPVRLRDAWMSPKSNQTSNWRSH